jgi:hypothetical protein
MASLPVYQNIASPLFIVGLLGYMSCNNQHGVDINACFGIESLHESASTCRHDPGFFIGQVNLIVRFRPCIWRFGCFTSWFPASLSLAFFSRSESLLS